MDRLRRQIASSGDPGLGRLLDELRAYPAPASAAPVPLSALVVPLILGGPDGPLSFISTTTVFGTPVEMTLSEIAMKSFFPADPATADTLRRLG